MIGEILILLLGIPAGYLIAWLGRDELLAGRVWFRVLVIVSIIGVVGFYLYGFSASAWTMGFVGIVSVIGLVKSRDKKWTRKR
jgi:prepilin signal peptidase PulO-like enzyme (type II secretory pathway)